MFVENIDETIFKFSISIKKSNHVCVRFKNVDSKTRQDYAVLLQNHKMNPIFLVLFSRELENIT